MVEDDVGQDMADICAAACVGVCRALLARPAL